VVRNKISCVTEAIYLKDHVGFEVLTAVSTKMSVLWVVAAWWVFLFLKQFIY
jgi:hypothetical protein